MTPEKRKLKLKEWETKGFSWRWLDKYEQPIDLTGWSAKVEIKDEEDNLVATATTETTDQNVYIVIEPEAGRWILKFKSALIEYNEKLYDGFLIDPDGSRIPFVLPSSITVSESITDFED